MAAENALSIKPSVERLYQELFELSPMATAVVDADGRCQLFNRAFLQWFGYEREFLLRGTVRFEDLFAAPAAARRLMLEILEKHVVRRRECQLRDHDGQPLTVLLSGRTLTLEDQPAVEIAFVNISQQKQLEAELRRNHARMTSLVEGLTPGLFLVDTQGIITDLNRAAANLLGVGQEALVGQPYSALFDWLIGEAREPEVTQKALNQAVIAVAERPLLLVKLREGERQRSFEIAFFPVWGEDALPLGWGGLVQDVTEAQNRLAWKLELLAILAHDIRAPLAALKGHATALLANYRQWGDDMVQEFLTAIDRRTDELVRQVDRSLALTRVETGQLGLRPEAIEPGQLIRQAVERLGGALGELHLTFDLPNDLPAVRADPARVEEVLINLLDNAARYAPAGEPIIIRAQAAGAWLEISVTDRGPGVPPERQRRIFDRYSWADSEGGAAGLGLFISRKIVEAHGGRIWMESPPQGTERGACFAFTLPQMPRPGAQPAAPQRFAAPAASPERVPRVLVVEDEPDTQALLRAILDQVGWAMEVAPDGPTAIDILGMSPPDLILLDLVLPGMDGLNVCRHIRRWSNVPILIVTSKTSQQDLVAALDAGADDFVTKPFQSAELLARSRALLRRGEAWIDEEPSRLVVGELAINFDAREAWLSGQRLDLTTTEYKLLAQLAKHRGRVLTYDQLLDCVYEPGEGRSRHDLFVHISRLRKKIEPEPGRPRILLTRRGLGYLFALE